MSGPDQSVFAVLTAPGRGGIAVVRCTGPRAEPVLEACFRPAAGRRREPLPRGGSPEPPRSDAVARRAGDAALPAVGRLAYGHLLDADGAVLDEIILYRAGADTFEVNCHGGPAAVEAVCRRLADLGLAQGDADALAVAEGAGAVEREARRRLRTAHTPLAARILLDQLAGALERVVAEARAGVAAGRADSAAAALDALLDRWRTCGRWLAEPPRVAVAGRPNVGKSTLLNRLAGAERAITSATPGTTRDYVETLAAFEGLPVVLVDTAGLRETGERVEREGVARAREQAAGADLVLYLLDASAGAAAEDNEALTRLGGRALAVWNKADLADGPLGPPGALAVSALAGEGMDALGRAVLERLAYRAPPPGEAVPLTAEQARALGRARRLLGEGRLDAACAALDAVTSPQPTS